MAHLAVTDAGLLTATMLAACRHLARHIGVQPPSVRAVPSKHYLTMAMEYKARCVKSVMDDIARHGSRVLNSDSRVSDQDAILADLLHKRKQVEEDNLTLAKIMVLVLDEVSCHYVHGSMMSASWKWILTFHRSGSEILSWRATTSSAR